MNQMSDKKLYTLPEAGDVLGISPWTIRKHVKLGTVVAVRCGRRVLVSETELTRIQREGLPSIPASTGEGAR